MSDFEIVQLQNPTIFQIVGGLNYQGEYDNGTTYAIGDVVYYLGSGYVATASTTGNLPTDTNFWQLVAQMGDTGVAGTDGDTGVAGVDGDTGVAGAGVDGDTGVAGVDGDTGTQGDTGSGTTGDTGADSTVAGDTGVQGDTGTQGVDGDTGATGTQGDAGDTGATGSGGGQGDTGAGTTGDTGTSGSVGADGDTGATGTTGDQGDTGSGTTGDTGATGSVGDQGDTGSGTTGDTGTSGAQGNQGDTGVGADGDTGVAGSAGDQGDTGVDGDTGTFDSSDAETFNFYNGTFQETFDATISESAGTVTMSLEQAGGGDLTMRFSDGYSILDCTPADTITLTVGTDSSPQENWIYILQSTKALTKSTSGWSTAEHIKVGFFFCQSAANVQSSGGTLINQNWNDHLQDTSNLGHMAHIAAKIRTMGADYFSGVDGAGVDDYLTITASNVEFKSTAGVIWQMHRHDFPAFDTSVSSIMHVKNWSGDAFHTLTNLFDIVADSTGTTIGNNKWFNLTFWGVQNKTGGHQTIMCNLPGGFYNSQADAESDISGYDDFTIPRQFDIDSSTAFLICRMTVKKATTWVYGSKVDLRGTTPQNASGGTPGSGLQGDTGVGGDTGVAGDQGDTGVGVQGDTGTQGVDGDTGATGTQGVDGDTGASGSVGSQGDTGSTGAAGTNSALSKSISVEDPTSSEDISMFFTPVAITVTEMRAVLLGSSTPSVSWTIKHHATDRSNAGNAVVTAGTTTTSVTAGSDVTSFNDATIPADSFVWLETTAQSGTVTEFSVTVVYTED